MRCTIAHMPATLIAIPLLAMGLDVRAQQQVPGETYTADLKGPWTCDSYADRQAEGWPPAGGGPFVVPLGDDSIPPEGEPVPPLVPPFEATPPFLGLNFAGARLEDSGIFPPDTMGAIGPNHFMEVINGNVSVFQRSNRFRIASESLASFFRHIELGADPFDPRVLFDQHSGRWIVVAAGSAGAIALAVSQSDNPTGTFCKTSFVASAGSDAPMPPDVYPFADYPTLGVDANGIYIGAKMQEIGTGTIWAIEKPPLLAVLPSSPSWGTITAWRGWSNTTNQPAHTYGTPGSQYIIGARSTNAVRIYRVDPPLNAPTLSTWTVPVEPWVPPYPTFPTLGGDVGNNAGGRLMMSVYRDGSLWTTHCIDIDNSRSGIRWYEINPTYPLPPNPNQAVRQWGNVTHPSLHFYMPSLMVNRAGHVALAFSGSDASSYVGAYYTGRRKGDATGDMAVPQLLKAGEGPYIGGRWGDYSYTTLDPLDESTFWTIQEYATPGGHNWGTWIAALGPFAICNDNNGNSPLVCVDWDQPRPPILNTDFSLGFGTNDPDVTFSRGNDGWNVWSQVSRTDATPANLGHIGIAPTSSGHDFSVTIAHLASAGAANVASMRLVQEGWTGQSNLSAGSIAGDLTGDLVVQESGGQGGGASFTIGGGVYGNVTIPKVDTFHVNGAVFGDLSFSNGLPSGAGVSIDGLLTDTGSVELHGQELAGGLSLIGGSAPQSTINVGALTGQINLFSSAYLGSATFTSIASGGGITIVDAILDGSINVLDDWNGSLVFYYGIFGAEAVISIGGSLSGTGSLFIDPVLEGMPGSLLIGQNCDGSIEVIGDMDGSIEVNGDMAGSIVVYYGDMDGSIEVNGDMAGNILVYGAINGNVTVHGEFNGNICGEYVSATAPLPGNIVIPEFGANATICGELVCGNAAQADSSVSKTRALSFSVPPTVPASGAETAIRVKLVDLQHPVPANMPGSVTRRCSVSLDLCIGTGAGNCPQTPVAQTCDLYNYSTFDTRLNGVCVGGSHAGHHCDVDADCRVCVSGSTSVLHRPCTSDESCSGTAQPGTCPATGGTCSSLVACTAAGEDLTPDAAGGFQGGCARWVGEPHTFLESQDLPLIGNYRASRLQCTPFYNDWSLEPMIHVVGGEILPSSEYEFQAVPVVGGMCASTVTIRTGRYGDVAAPFNPPTINAQQPDGSDIVQLVNKFRNQPGAPVKAISLIQPNLPEINGDVSGSDITRCVDAVRQVEYRFLGPCPCPSLAVCGALACPKSGTVCTQSALPGLGRDATCIRTCTGGDNDGDPCVNNDHCPGGGTCGNPFCRDRCGRCN